jgi:hypothetical protein
MAHVVSIPILNECEAYWVFSIPKVCKHFFITIGELFYISNPFLKVNFRYTGWSLDSWLFSSEKCICSRQEEARWYSFGFKSQVWGKHFLARQGRIEIGQVEETY